MSLFVRTLLLVSGLILLTATLSWGIAGRAVVEPLARALLASEITRAISTADRIDSGESLRSVQNALKVDVRTIASFEVERRRSRRRCDELIQDGRELVWCRGPRAPVAIKLKDGSWLAIRRDLDPDEHRAKFARLLGVIFVFVLGMGLWLARVLTRPIRAAEAAVRRIAQGDLDHRLPETGPRELREFAIAYNGLSNRVREMLESERKLMAGLSHELRTPIARVNLELELLRDAGAAGDRLDAMAGDVAEMDRLIAELMESSRLSIGERKLDLEPIETQALAELAVRRAKPTKHVEISGNSSLVQVDRDRLGRALSNLIENAEKYAPESSSISVVLDGGTIEVIDRGKGVPEESLGRLFEPFYRVPREDRKKGTGLGLMLCRQIVELHGGSVRARNLDGGGFSVRVELPAKSAPVGTQSTRIR